MIPAFAQSALSACCKENDRHFLKEDEWQMYDKLSRHVLRQFNTKSYSDETIKILNPFGQMVIKNKPGSIYFIYLFRYL
jgi:hypothetical protein